MTRLALVVHPKVAFREFYGPGFQKRAGMSDFESISSPPRPRLLAGRVSCSARYNYGLRP